MPRRSDPKPRLARLTRVLPDYAYGPGPRAGCFWDDTAAAPGWPQQNGSEQAEVAIIGGGFTGLSCALHLAEAGVDTLVLEAETPGFGASGRNGGFCCLGGTMLPPELLKRRYGDSAAQAYTSGEVEAVRLVQELIARHDIQCDTHSNGETILAHSPRQRQLLREEEGDFVDGPDLAAHGLGGPFFAALTTPVGFGLNPRKYLFGLAAAAETAGARLYQNSPAQPLQHDGTAWKIPTPQGQITARRVIIATNGYSSDTLHPSLNAHVLPAQSSILVTRPLTEAERAAQGWTSRQMAYDTRALLHYFRLLPDNRFLFGMRGGLWASPRAEAAARARLLRHFHQMFPAWAEVDITHSWSGLVALSQSLMPFVGPVPGHADLFAGLCYHGNGVAMGTYAGRLLSDLLRDQDPTLPYSAALRDLKRFSFGKKRHWALAPTYAILSMVDRSDAISSAIAALSPRHRQ